jgi:predicted metal-binding membrane protein
MTAGVSRAVPRPVLDVIPIVLLLALAAVCWVVTAQRMDGMDMGPGTELGGLGWFAGIWAVMMAAMMLPSLVPMERAYGGAARGEGGWSFRPVAATTGFTAGYLLVWVLAGVVAYAVFEAVRSLDPAWLAWDRGGPYIAGGVIVGAALYELTPAKATCLRHCRQPELLTQNRRPGLMGAMRDGIGHGGYCVGCSWALMAALFALGVMGIGWMVNVAAAVAIEKLLPWSAVAVAATVSLLVVLGLGVAFFPGNVPGLTIPGSGQTMGGSMEKSMGGSMTP